MPVSVLYKNLRKRILKLRKQLLDFQPGDSYLPKNQDELRAFKLLVHAEIESYIENAVLEVWNKCNNEWKTNKRVITPLAFLIMYSPSKFEANDQQLTKETRIAQILTSFKASITNNNGIKKRNILQLVVPLGIGYLNIDQTWLATIDSYGSSRGDVAHNSFSVQQQLDRNDELKNLDLVLKGIKKMDIKLQKISSSRRRPF
ncbi:MAG: HEPN domain-containing protein [Syntrophales bacterium]